MMHTSIALAQIFAIYLTVMGISMLINQRFFKAIIKDLIHSHIAMLIIAAMTLILGSILITLHNVWALDWRLSITAMCWLVMLSGVVRTLFPAFVQRSAASLLSAERYFTIGGVMSILMGGVYGYLGFWHLMS